MYKEQIKNLIQPFSFFKNMSDEEMDAIVDISGTRKLAKDSHIFMQDEPLSNVYFIYDGQVKIYRTDLQGKEQIVNILKEGDLFPHLGFFRKTNYPANALVTEDVTLIYIPIHLFEQFLFTHPQAAMKVIRLLGDKIFDLQNRLEEKILHNTYEQIILLLIRLAKSHGKLIDHERTVLLSSLTNQELANMIGSSRETISRTLSQLKKKYLIQTNEKGQMIIYIESLKEELF